VIDAARRDRRRLSASVVVAVLVAAILTACTSDETAEEGDAVADVFARYGIAVLDDVADEWPEQALLASPAYAVGVMQAEVDSAGGVPGADLDELAPMPEGAPPFSYLVAAWLMEGTTDRATAARRWMPADIDWSRAPTIWYPRAALLLFVADAMEASLADFGALTDASETPAARGGGLVRGADYAGGVTVAGAVSAVLPEAPCTLVTDFFAQTINRIFGAVQLPPDFLGSGGILGSISGFLANLFNSAVALAKAAVVKVIDTLTGPALRAIASAVAVVGITSHVSSYLLGVSMMLVSTRDPVQLDGQPGYWHAIIDTKRPLEAQLNDCLARLGQRPLPDIVKVGEFFSWRGELPVKANGKSIYEKDVLFYPQPQVAAVDEAKRVVIPWVANTVEMSSSKPVEYGKVRVRAEVPKGDVTDLFRTVEDLLSQAVAQVAAYGGPLAPQIDAELRRILYRIFEDIKQGILNAGRSVLMILGSGETSFEYREPDDPTPPPGAPVPNCFTGMWRFESVQSRWLDLSRAAFSRFTLEVGGGGSYAVRVAGFAVADPAGGFWTTYRGATRFTVAPGPSGSWAVTAPPLTASESYAALHLSVGNGYAVGGDDYGGSAMQERELQYQRLKSEIPVPLGFATESPEPDGAFGEAVFGAGLRPVQFACGADGQTLTVTGEADARYGPAVWHFRRL
jgi:hypothetical protein